MTDNPFTRRMMRGPIRVTESYPPLALHLRGTAFRPSNCPFCGEKAKPQEAPAESFFLKGQVRKAGDVLRIELAPSPYASLVLVKVTREQMERVVDALKRLDSLED